MNVSSVGLAVFWESEPLSSHEMQQLTQELRQFESIFLTKSHSPQTFKARIFTEDEELNSAGHPILGVEGNTAQIDSIYVSGNVSMVAMGVFD